jgi:hypothetical protein
MHAAATGRTGDSKTQQALSRYVADLPETLKNPTRDLDGVKTVMTGTATLVSSLEPSTTRSTRSHG